jgi:hypothetical protein
VVACYSLTRAAASDAAGEAPMRESILSKPTRTACPDGIRFPRRRAADVAYARGTMNDVLTGVIWSLAPTVLVGLIFWVVMRAVVHADRSERKAYAKVEAEERAKRGLPQKP